MPSSPWFEPLPARATYQAEAHAENRAALAEAAAAACARTAPALLAMQKPEGYWVGDLLADSTLESDYVLLQLWLHPPRDGEWKPPSWDRIQRAREAILARQKSDGGFNIYPDGPADVNATIKAYIALKLAGLGSQPRADAAGARRDSQPGRHPGGEQLRPDQPEPLRPVSEAPRADDPGGAGPRAGRAHLRDVVLDARDRHAADHHPGQDRHPPRARGLHPGRAGGAGQELQAAEARPALRAVPPARHRAQDVGDARAGDDPAARDPRGREVGPGSHAEQRRARRHLPVDDVPDHGARRARLPARPSRPHRGHPPVRGPADRDAPTRSTSSPASRRCGTPPSRCSRSGRWARWPPPRCGAAPTGSSPRRSGAAATGR